MEASFPRRALRPSLQMLSIAISQHLASRLRKKAFRTLLALSVISPRRGELNISGAERRSELTSPRGANQKGRKPVYRRAERVFIYKYVSTPC